MFDYIMIHTIDGNINRYDKRIVKNFHLFTNEDELEKLINNKIITVELNSRRINFISSNIVKIEIIREVEAI